MSRKSSVIVLSATVVLTLFIAVTAYFYNPQRGNAVYSAEVKSEAEKRQGQSLVSVTEPLDTDLQSRQNDDKIADRVAAKLTEDDSFMTAVGDRSVEYVDSKMGDIESKYASSTDEKISSAAESVRSDIKSADEIASDLLESETFMSALESAVKEKMGEEYDAEALAASIVSSEAFRSALSKMIEEEKSDSVPLPSFSSSSNADYSENEYRDARSQERSDEISRVLSFLGY